MRNSVEGASPTTLNELNCSEAAQICCAGWEQVSWGFLPNAGQVLLLV